jgi:hypothetical protein
MRYLCLLPLIAVACSSKPVAPHETTYRECISRQDKIRKERFETMPEKLRALAGKHSVVKYFDKRPRDLAAVVERLRKENGTFNARQKKDVENDLDLRLMDTSPGRNRVLIGFEKRADFVFAKSEADTLLFKMDFSKPVVGYYFPLSRLRETGDAYEGYFSSSAKIKTPKGYTGNKTIAKTDIYIYVQPVDKDYLYIEWVNRAYDPEDDPNWKGIHAVLYTHDDDRFLDWESPYFNNKGELNPEECAAFPGG